MFLWHFKYSLPAINQPLKRMYQRVSPLHGYQSNCPSFHNDRPRRDFITPNNYVFVLPLLHHLHRSSRLFIGPLDSTGKGFAFTAVSVQHTLCDNSQYSYAINDPMPSALILSAFASGLSFRGSCFRSCLLSLFYLSVDLPLSWAFFP